MIKKKPRSVDRDKVRRNATEGPGGGSVLKLPKGIKEWFPEDPGRYLINVLPYLVTDPRHPDNVDKGVKWYKRSYRVHFTTDGRFACPKTGPEGKSAKCPWCKEFFRLKKEGADDVALYPFKGQSMDMYNVQDPDNKDAVAVMTLSFGKFTKPLNEEIDQADDSNLLFFEVTKKRGRTLSVRFSQKKFNGKKFIQATKFDFKPRKDRDEDEVLAKVANLDEVLKVEPYEVLKKAFLQIDEDDEDEKKKGKKPKKPEGKPAKKKRDPDEDEAGEPEKKGKKKPKGKKPKKDDDSEEE